MPLLLSISHGIPNGCIMRKLLTAFLIGVFAIDAQETPSTHTIAVTFNYDFRITPACSPSLTQKCVNRFNIYDISAGVAKSAKIGSIPLPVNAQGLVKGISGVTEPFLFNPGRHRIAVSAQMPDGTESDLRLCWTIVQIP